jgi:8-amino-7-oxononanoate synthase
VRTFTRRSAAEMLHLDESGPLNPSSPFDAELAELRSRSLLRKLRELDSPQQPEMELTGRRLLNFSSNDYLGLATEPALREAAKQAIDEYGVGSGASRLVCGTLAPHARLEEKLAEWKRAEAALAFSSGYAAAVGTLGALLRKDDVVILDKLAHASLIDGAKLSGAILRVFPHNHLGKLESHLKWARDNHPDARIVLATESVFSMDGDWCPLAEIVEIKNRYGALLLLDEAHAVGVIGDGGRGLAEKLGLAAQVDIQLGTLSKALGCSGGYVCGSRPLIDLLINRARSFIYSTAPAPAIAAAACAAVQFLMTPAGERRRQDLRARLSLFAEEMPALFPPGRKVQSAIFPVILGSSTAALEAAGQLAEAGFYVPAIRYPTVPKDRARLRVTLSARHTPEQVKALCAELRKLAPRTAGEDVVTDA